MSVFDLYEGISLASVLITVCVCVSHCNKLTVMQPLLCKAWLSMVSRWSAGLELGVHGVDKSSCYINKYYTVKKVKLRIIFVITVYCMDTFLHCIIIYNLIILYKSRSNTNLIF